MMDDTMQRIETNRAEPQIFMPVFGCTGYIFTVVNMKDGNLIFPQYFIKLIDDPFKIMNNVISLSLIHI